MTIRNLRWWIAGLLALATAINYLDRQTLPVVIGELQKTIPVDAQQYSQLQALFLLAYAIMYAAGGRIVDALGTRAGYALFIAWWSAATVLHGAANSVMGLGISRFLLGLGEGGGFPASAKAVSEWFPAKERSFAFGIFNTGSSLGAVLAPPLIAGITMAAGWRWVFFATGIVGFVWLAAWLTMYRKPAAHPYISAGELSYLQRELSSDTTEAQTGVSGWRGVLRFRETWGLVVAKLLSDSAWYFFIFWLPKYLGDVRGLDIRQIGYYAWIPYAFAGAGSFAGGWFSSYLVQRGRSINFSRKLTLSISAGLMPLSLLIADSPLSLAILFFGTAMFAHQCWSTIMQTLAADIFPTQAVGTVSGLMGAAGSFGAMLFNLLVGAMLGHFGSYYPVFFVAGLLHPLSLLILFLSVRRIERLKPAAALAARPSSER
jgi:ACS family hexuronate transporter-like MFS transporter